MKIGFLSLLNPDDINFWSGTLYFIFNTLKKDHQVEWLGGDLLQKIQDRRSAFAKPQRTFCPEAFAREFGQTLSAQIESMSYNVLVVLEASLGAYLDTTVPIILISDTTFHNFRHYLSNTSDAFIELAERVEQDAIDNADLIIYSSEWAKANAIEVYGADPNKIAVVEFGANLIDIPTPSYYSLADSSKECRLLFIGKDWEKKGGDKVYEAYKILQSQGFPCSLSVIGSTPPFYDRQDKHLRVIPFVDKSQMADRELMDVIFKHTHLLILPTVFDCFGIVFCEASAYGVPSIASDVGGVSQVVRNGENGFLLSAKASAQEYATVIKQIFQDKEQYARLRDRSRKTFDERLNWETWRIKINDLFTQVVTDNAAHPRLRTSDAFYIPTYIIHLEERPERRIHMENQFAGRDEFELIWVDACRHKKGTVGLWESIRKAVSMAVERDDDVMILCEDDHYFTEYYNKEQFIAHIIEAHEQGTQLLIGGVGGFGSAFPTAPSRYWVDWYWSNQFLVIYRSAYRKILDYEFSDNDTADGVLSKLLSNKETIYPMISRQKSFGYSDVTSDNHCHPQYIEYYFDAAAERLERIREAFDQFYPPDAQS